MFIKLMDYTFTFDPKKRGLRQILGDLEAEIMELVWDIGDVTVRDVHERLSRKRAIAYTTVMTVMSRLSDKGLLTKKKTGTAHLYYPTSSRKEFTESSVKTVINKLIQEFASPTINQFVEYLDIEDPEKLEELSRLIEEKRKNRHD
ncbi:BlaI/MecI/CopY family transcriptional regulator [candidate division KSB1 bacterium]